MVRNKNKCIKSSHPNQQQGAYTEATPVTIAYFLPYRSAIIPHGIDDKPLPNMNEDPTKYYIWRLSVFFKIL